jgi:hypothetical protein
VGWDLGLEWCERQDSSRTRKFGGFATLRGDGWNEGVMTLFPSLGEAGGKN